MCRPVLHSISSRQKVYLATISSQRCSFVNIGHFLTKFSCSTCSKCRPLHYCRKLWRWRKTWGMSWCKRGRSSRLDWRGQGPFSRRFGKEFWRGARRWWGTLAQPCSLLAGENSQTWHNLHCRCPDSSKVGEQKADHESYSCSSPPPSSGFDRSLLGYRDCLQCCWLLRQTT